MPFRMFKLVKREKTCRCSPLVSILVGMYIVMGFTVINMSIAYVTAFMGTDHLRRILQDVMQHEDLSGYNLYKHSTSADTIEFDTGPIHYNCDTKSGGQSTAASIPSSAHNSTVVKASPAIARKSERFSVLVGILTTSSTFDRWHQLRLAYSTQSSDEADFTVRFVLGAMEKEEDRIWVGMENATYGDIIVLPCQENMNEGKTFTYFVTLVAMGLKYDYVMKTDDDSYVRFSNLGRQLSPMARTDLYYGYTMPCNEEPNSHFVAGAGYLISWDLVLWINNSSIPRNRTIGPEDILVGDWFRDGGVAKNRPFSKGLFHDYPGDFPCGYELGNDTILVHHLKSPERWRLVVTFFEANRLSKSQ